MDNIILIGMPGAGKSTVGVLLAKTLGYAFLDTDLVIQQREGALLQPLVDSLGVEAFLDVEADAICSVECRGTVIAPGGSAVCRERAMSHLRALGRIVYLHLPLEELERRNVTYIDSEGLTVKFYTIYDHYYIYRSPISSSGGEDNLGDGWSYVKTSKS